MKTPAPRMVALRYRDFRLLWFGRAVSGIGTWMQRSAVNWHVFQFLKDADYTLSFFGQNLEIDGGALGLGVLGPVRIFPVILFVLLGGIMADTYDRRRLMIRTQSIATVIALTLAAVTITGQATVKIIYILTAASSAAMAFDSPARNALVVNLVPNKHLTNALSLNTTGGGAEVVIMDSGIHSGSPEPE